MMIIRWVSSLFLVLLSSNLLAANKIDGLWQATYAKSGTPSSHIQITTLSSGKLQGVIKEAYPRPGAKNVSPNCVACSGANKNKPIIGMRVLWGLKPDGKNQWTGGHVLDVEEGKEYNANIKLSDDGNTIHLRGYVMTPALGQTVVWTRLRAVP